MRARCQPEQESIPISISISIATMIGRIGNHWQGGRHVLFSLVQEVDFFGLLFLIELLLWSMVWVLMQPLSRIQSGSAAEWNRCVWARGVGSPLAEGCDARCLVWED